MRRHQLVVRHRLVVWSGVVMVAIAGCASEEAPPPVVVSPSPSPTAANPTTSPAANPTASPTAPGITTTSPTGTQPLVAQRPAPPPSVPGLIQSTNPQERGRQVETEIRAGKTNNPFAGLPVVIPKSATVEPVPNVSQLPRTRPNSAQRPGGGNANRTPTRQQPGTTGQPGTTVAAAPGRAIEESPTIPKPEGADEGALGTYIPPIRPPAPAAPPPPSIDAAQAVEVTGVVTVGNKAQAIVTSPDEPSSRYVAVGQRISNGRVLVKRIENNGSEPTVILEQNGVEVAKSVGAKAPTSKPAGVS